MSKNKNNLQEAEIVEDTPLANPQGKTVDELVEIIQTLQAQKKDHQTKAQEAQAVMNRELSTVTKAQGAIEVILQMIPKEKVKQLIEQEAKENGAINDS